jgi:hypothetical protein
MRSFEMIGLAGFVKLILWNHSDAGKILSGKELSLYGSKFIEAIA